MRKSLFIALLLFLTLSLFGCSANQPAPQETTEATTQVPFDLDQYKQDVAECTEKIKAEAIVVYNVAKKERDYIDISETISGKTADPDKAKEAAYKWLEEKSDYSAETVDAGYTEIAKMYKNIIAVDVEGSEAEEIRSEFDDYATAYINLYNLALKPSGSAYSFGENCDVCISALRTGQNKLSILLS